MVGRSSRSEFVIPNSFALRTPALAWDEIEAWGEGARGSSPEAFRLLRERMAAIFERPEVREAIYVASPGLLSRLEVWQRDPDCRQGRELELALVRYLVRMSTRATPFGLFSGIGTGKVGNTTRLELPPLAAQARKSRLDNEVLFDLASALARDPERRKTMRFRSNTSLYRVAGRLRYAEARRGERGRIYHLVSVEPTSYLDATLERAREGARLDELATALVQDDSELELAEAQSFVSQLCDAELLVPDLAVAVTGPDPLNAFVAQLERAELAAVAERLGAVRAALEALDDARPCAPIASYAAISEALVGLPVEPDPARLVQVDRVRPPCGASLGQGPVREVLRAVDVLWRLTPRASDPLADFKRAFRERYEQASVPLTVVLDEEAGVGLSRQGVPPGQDAPLLAGLPFPPLALAGWQPADGLSSPERDRVLLGKLMAASAAGAHEIVLEEADLKAMSAGEPAPLPDAWSVMVRIAAGSSEAIGRGEFSLLVERTYGPSGANLLGRFCQACPELDVLVREHLRAEEAHRPEVVFAEIAHLPEGRIGNVLCRPVLRDYEIVFLGQSGAPSDRQIAITDLELSLRGERLVLYSRRLGREVVPRLTSAHNFSQHGLGIYRFLGSLQLQGVQGAAWSWGSLQPAPFLPRVRCGRAVFARAQWQLSRRELDELGKVVRVGARPPIYDAVQALRERRGLPRFVVVADGDNELALDLDNALTAHAFADLLTGRKHAQVLEQFPSPEELCVRGPSGRYSHELCLAFVRAESKNGLAAGDARAPQFETTPWQRPSGSLVEAPEVRRSLTLGSGCLYLKLYCGTATADRVLDQLVAPVAAEALAARQIQSWFFLRYGDPQPHLRVRFFGQPQHLAAELWPAFERAAAGLLREGAIWRLVTDTYDRELERYGGVSGMELVEQVFWLDSEACVEALRALQGDAGAELRWLVALRGADQLLADLGFDPTRRLQFYTRAQDELDREHRTGADLHRALGKLFRSRQADIERVLRPATKENLEEADPLELAIRAFTRRSSRLAPIAAELAARDTAGKLQPRLGAFAWSLVHMHVNRLLSSAQRSQELVLSNLLRRHHAAQRARQPGTRERQPPTRSAADDESLISSL